jgi:hypothetical protein
MVTKTIVIYTFFDDILKSKRYKEPQNRKVSDPEVSAVILIAVMYFGGNIETAIRFVRFPGLMPACCAKAGSMAEYTKSGDCRQNCSSESSTG